LDKKKLLVKVIVRNLLQPQKLKETVSIYNLLNLIETEKEESKKNVKHENFTTPIKDDEEMK
jgi:hypothetical protein